MKKTTIMLQEEMITMLEAWLSNENKLVDDHQFKHDFSQKLNELKQSHQVVENKLMRTMMQCVYESEELKALSYEIWFNEAMKVQFDDNEALKPFVSNMKQCAEMFVFQKEWFEEMFGPLPPKNRFPQMC